MSIYINGSVLGTQPSILNEEDMPLQTDQEAIDGTTRRNKNGQKKRSTMHFPDMPPADYRNLKNQFVTGSGVIYYNDASNETPTGIFTFSGLPTYTENPYLPGASLYRDFDVVIREI
jgi:hypothetical protein